MDIDNDNRNSGYRIRLMNRIRELTQQQRHWPSNGYEHDDVMNSLWYQDVLFLLPISNNNFRSINIGTLLTPGAIPRFHRPPYVLNLFDVAAGRTFTLEQICEALHSNTLRGINLHPTRPPYNDFAFANNSHEVDETNVQLFKTFLRTVKYAAEDLKASRNINMQLDMIHVSAFSTVHLLECVVDLLELDCTTILKLKFLTDDILATGSGIIPGGKRLSSFDRGLTKLGDYMARPSCTLTELAFTGLTPACYNRAIELLSAVTGESPALRIMTLCDPVNFYSHRVLDRPITNEFTEFLREGHLGANLEHIILYELTFESTLVDDILDAVKKHKLGDLKLTIGGYYSHGLIDNGRVDYVRVMPVSFRFQYLRRLEQPYHDFSATTERGVHLSPAGVISKAHRLAHLWLLQVEELGKSLYEGYLIRGDAVAHCQAPFTARLENEQVEVWFRFFCAHKSDLFHPFN